MPSDSNSKLSGDRKTWRAGAYVGHRLYSLTLVERDYCPNDCPAWNVCYGDNMRWANRIDARQDIDVFYTRLTGELDTLDRKHPDGYSVRLHILGDFWNVAYVRFWGDQLATRRALNVYGYTHRTGEIHDAIDSVFMRFGRRFNILQSDGDRTREIRPVALLESHPDAGDLPICPEQTGKATGCLDCGLCTLDNVKGVTFLLH